MPTDSSTPDSAPPSQTLRQPPWEADLVAPLPGGRFKPHEEWAWSKIARGEIADMAGYEGEGGKVTPDPRDPESFRDWHVLSELFLRTILFHEPWASAPERPGVRIMNARVREAIDWSGRATVGEVWFDRCRFEAGFLWQGGRVPGLLSFDGAVLVEGLKADRIELAGGFFCRDGFVAEQEIVLSGAKVGGNVEFIGATLKGALQAPSLSVAGDLYCSGGFVAEHEIVLRGAKVGGGASFIGATLKGVLKADGFAVERGLFCRDGFVAEQEIFFLGARIGGQASFVGATLRGALQADGLEVAGGFFCRGGFVAEDDICLIRAKVGGSLEFDGATLNGALQGDGLTVAGDLFLRDMKRIGAVKLLGATIGGTVQLRQSRIEGHVDFTGATIGGAFELAQKHGSEPIWAEGSELILRNVTADAFAGSLAAFKQEQAKAAKRKSDFVPTDLLGFRYARIGGLRAATGDTLAAADAASLVAWLEAGTGDGKTFTPGPYRQLAKELGEAGHEDKARRVRHATARHERRCAKGLRKVWLALSGVFIGFGYRPWYAMFWFVALITVFAGIGLSTSDSAQVGAWFWFSLGNAIPVVELDAAHKTFLAQTFGDGEIAPIDKAWPFYLEKLLGFVILTYLAAGLSGLAKRGDD